MRLSLSPLSLPTNLLPGLGTGILIAGAMGSATLAPMVFWLLLTATVAAGVVYLAFRHTTTVCVIWLLITAGSIEMAMSDLFGLSAFQPTIAALKASQIALAAICVVRWGPRLDPFNPAWGFGLMTLSGLAGGLHPALTQADSLRSMLGSIAPYAFCFARPSLAWANAILGAVRWAPIVAVAAGIAAHIAGVRPLFVDSGGARLSGLGHPAFLAGVCLAGIYAGLIEAYRHARTVDLAMLATNLSILLLTGARAPLAYAAGVILLSLVFVRSSALPARFRLLTVLAAGAILPVLIVLAGEFAFIRAFNVLSENPTHLSGRDYLWAIFERAAAGAPWFGWGVGAGNVIVQPDSEIAQMLRTWAAHNEYLRIQVEGGYVGRAVLVGLFALWAWRRTVRLRQSDRVIMRLVFLAFAAHAVTDNVLISTPSCVLFTFAAAVFARGEREAQAAKAATFPVYLDRGAVAG